MTLAPDLAALFDLTGRVAIVTGAASWLGTPMATGLAQAGAHVYLAGRRPAPLTELADDLQGHGLSAEALPFDVTDKEAARAALTGIEKAHGRLDVLVNNAHAGALAGLEADEADFAAAMDSAVTGAWRLVRDGLPLLHAAVAASGDASIVNVASMYGKVSPDPRVYAETDTPPSPPFYGAAKAGLLQLTRWLATNLGPAGIRANAISPGPFPQWDARERRPDFVARLDSKTPLGRAGRRDEIKGAVVFLASPASSYVTGADLAVDGGWTAW